MSYMLSSKARKTSFGNQLVDENNDNDSTDEASQERPAQHVIQKSQTEEASNEDEGTSHACDNSSDLSIQPAVHLT